MTFYEDASNGGAVTEAAPAAAENARSRKQPTPCAICKKETFVPVSQMLLNVGLMRKTATKVSAAAAAPPPMCDVCEVDEAKQYCNDCSKFKLLCHGCFASAHKSATKKGHVSFPVEQRRGEGGVAGCWGRWQGGPETTTAAAAAAVSRKLCSIHPDHELGVFCDDCGTLVCAMCGILHHNGHNLIPVAQAAVVQKNKTKELLAEVAASRMQSIAAANKVKAARGALEGKRDDALLAVYDGSVNVRTGPPA